MSDERIYELPLFPLGTVLYPGNPLPLRIFEPRYVDLVSACMREDRGFGVVAIRAGNEAGIAADTFDSGTYARIIDFDRGADGLLNLVIRGQQRIHIGERVVGADQLIVAQVRDLADITPQPIPDKHADLAVLVGEMEKNIGAGNESQDPPNDSAALAYRLLQFLPIALDIKVRLLEANDAQQLLDMVATEIARLKAASERA